MFEEDEIEEFIIHSAIVYLDDDVPEYMDGIIRVGSVQFFDENGNEIDNTDLNNKLVDNQEFRSEEQVIKSIAKRLDISVDNVEVEY